MPKLSRALAVGLFISSFGVSVTSAHCQTKGETIQPVPGPLDESATKVSPKDHVDDLANGAEAPNMFDKIWHDHILQQQMDKKLAEFDGQVRVPISDTITQLDTKNITLLLMRIGSIPGTNGREVLDVTLVGRGPTFTAAMKSYLKTSTREVRSVPEGEEATTVFVAEHPANSSPNSPIDRSYSAWDRDTYYELKNQIAEDDENQKKLAALAQSDPELHSKLDAYLSRGSAAGMIASGYKVTVATVYVTQNPISNKYSLLQYPDGWPVGAGNSEAAAYADYARKVQLHGEVAPYDVSGNKLMPIHVVTSVNKNNQVEWKAVDYPSTNLPQAIKTIPQFQKEIDSRINAEIAREHAVMANSMRNVPAPPQSRPSTAPQRGPDGTTYTGPGAVDGGGGGGGTINCSPGSPCITATPLPQ